MEHPLIGDIEHLTIDELSLKITELNKKLNIAMRSGNADLCNQIRMAIETYRGKYMQKSQDLLNKGKSNNFNDMIDIS